MHRVQPLSAGALLAVVLLCGCDGSSSRRLKIGVAFFTEDRRGEGLLMEASVQDNMVLASLAQFAAKPLGLIRRRPMRARAKEPADSLHIECRSLARQPAQTLSGGNQQKAVLAKWPLGRADVFILDEPTRAVDVGAKYLKRLTEWALEEPEADQDASQLQERFVDVRSSFKANPQAAELMKPTVRAFDNPPKHAQAAAVFPAAFGEHRSNATPPQTLAMAFGVVRPVPLDTFGASSPSTLAADLGNCIHGANRAHRNKNPTLATTHRCRPPSRRHGLASRR